MVDEWEWILLRPLGLVRIEGLEPPRVSPPDPKSGAATNYATCAGKFHLQLLFFNNAVYKTRAKLHFFLNFSEIKIPLFFSNIQIG